MPYLTLFHKCVPPESRQHGFQCKQQLQVNHRGGGGPACTPRTACCLGRSTRLPFTGGWLHRTTGPRCITGPQRCHPPAGRSLSLWGASKAADPGSPAMRRPQNWAWGSRAGPAVTTEKLVSSPNPAHWGLLSKFSLYIPSFIIERTVLPSNGVK